MPPPSSACRMATVSRTAVNVVLVQRGDRRGRRARTPRNHVAQPLSHHRRVVRRCGPRPSPGTPLRGTRCRHAAKCRSAATTKASRVTLMPGPGLHAPPPGVRLLCVVITEGKRVPRALLWWPGKNKSGTRGSSRQSTHSPHNSRHHGLAERDAMNVARASVTGTRPTRGTADRSRR